MNTTSHQHLSLRALWLSAGLIGALFAPGCGDDLPTEDTADAVIEDVGDADGTAEDAACTGDLGCPCSDDDACDSGYCDGEGDAAVCAKPCETDGKAGCDDGNVCTVDTCVAATADDESSTCEHQAATEGATCSDGDACTTGDGCTGGTCTGTAAVCNDDNPCTTDSCDKATGCTTAPDQGKACDDGDACTGGKAGAAGDVCKDGSCVGGAAVNCDDGNPCTTDSCDKATGCGYAALDGGTCEDGSACTGTSDKPDTCVKGVCDGGAPVVCDDSNPCTTDACAPADGCTVTDAVGKACDDDDACTVGDSCKAGGCAPGAKLSCDDGNPCTTDSCTSGKGAGATDPKGCVNAPVDGQGCDDGSACTGTKAEGDTCVKGACKPGAPVGCDDDNPCTTDACEPATGCTATDDDGAKCVPGTGNKCDTGGVCAGGACKVAQQVGCDDGNPCTTDACDKASGLCQYTKAKDGAACDDGNACTAGDSCSGGLCKSKPKVCDDDNPCTADACDPAPKTGAAGCTTAALDGKACSDGTVCTSGDACKGSTCTPGAKLSCDDGNPCTTDACDKVKGCVSTKKTGTCEDGNACTGTEGAPDTCKDGWCQAGSPKSCDDGNACTTDSCDPTKGCANTPVAAPCDDGNLCTVADTCDKGACKAGEDQSCDDNNACTADTCDPKAGCKSVSTKAPCSDGDTCTVGDACVGDLCVPGTGVKNCDDDNACTVDVCDPKKGCVYTDSLNACTDNDACTVGDACKSGKCVAGAKQQCDDGNPCTDDACDATKGCVQKPNSKSCDDGNACTLGDACKNGYCQGGGKAKVCDDGNGCTDDFCDPTKGCTAVLTTKLCDDGNACTVDDACTAGKCKGGKPKDCDDDNSCTDDSCDQKLGCGHKNNTTNPFTNINDTGAVDSGKWTFAASKGAVAFSHVGAGYYRQAAGVAGTTYTMTRTKPLDLACTGTPTIYLVSRHSIGKAEIQVSLDGKAWKTLGTLTGSDHVWRRRYWDLKPYVNKLMYVRFLATVTGANQWWDLQGIEVKNKEPLPKKVAWGTALTCKHFAYEGPAFSCDASEQPYQLRYHGVVKEPDTNIHANTAYVDLLLDTKGVANPAIRFEERSANGQLQIDVREPEGKWTQVYTRSAANDNVWRPRAVYLQAFKGKVLQLRFRSAMTPTSWTHVRNITLKNEAPPTAPPIVKAPVKLDQCALWAKDGTAWVCDQAQTIFKLAYVGDPSVDYNTNNFDHRLVYQRRIDLSAVKVPQLSFEQRYNYGNLYVRASVDGKAWTTLTSHGNGTDYVWRTALVDLSSWKAKKTPIYIQVQVRPYYPYTWGHLRNIQVIEKAPDVATVAYGTKLTSCGWWSWEGPSWKCDPTASKWLFRADGVADQPSPNGYWQYNTLQRWIEVPNKGQPSFAIQYRRHFSYISLQVSTNGTNWTGKNSNTGNHGDYVWRTLKIDLSQYKGKKIRVRIGVVPRDYGRWAEIRNPSFQEFDTWPTVKFGGVPLCQDWEFEGTAWSCGKGTDGYQLRYTGSSEQPSPDYQYHYATRAALIDLAGTQNPTLYFEAKRSYGYLRVFVWGPKDSYQQLLDTGAAGIPYFHRYAIDLTKFAGKQIYVRFGVLPYSPVAAGEIRNMVFKEREQVTEVKWNHTFTPKDFWMEGGWHFDSNGQYYELDGTVKAHYQAMDSVVKVNLKGLTTPQLSFRQTYSSVTRYVYVREENGNWQTAKYYGNGTDPIGRIHTVDLSQWKDKTVYLRFRGYPHSAASTWRVWDINFHEKQVIQVVPPSTVLTKWITEGLWEWSDLLKAYAMNYGVGGATQDKLLLSQYQYLTATQAWDVSKLSKPTLHWEALGNGSTSYRYVYISVDGGAWVSASYWPYEIRTDAYLPHYLDLSKFKAKATIRVRFRGYPSTNDYYWSVRNVHMGEPTSVTSLPIGTKLADKHFDKIGAWQDKSGYFEVVPTKTGGTNWLIMHHYAYNLQGVSKAAVTFEESYVKGSRYIQCSGNGGLSWSNLWSTSTSSQDFAYKQRVLNLNSSCLNKPDVRIRFIFGAYYGPGERWRIRNIVLVKK